MTPPLDLTALARETAHRLSKDIPSLELSKAVYAGIVSALTQSRTAGRAEGLENAAKWHDAEAMQAELSAARLEAAGLAINAGHWRVEAREARARATAIRALASDPAPGEQVAPYPGACWCLDCGAWDDRSGGRSHHVGHRLTHLPGHQEG